MLLEKSLERNWTCLVKTTPEMLDYFDRFLWTYRKDSFLPHGLETEPLSDYNPILLSSKAQTHLGKDVVILTHGQDIENFDGVKRSVFMINGKNSNDVAHARTRWSQFKSKGANLSYYQQGERGQWIKKA